jgi:tripeptide aminopeptidase
MDTVAPGEGVVPVLDGTILRSDGRTVLGGDDKSGVAIICEALRVVREKKIPCGPVDVAFTICEEAGLLGAKCLDVSRLKARTGLVLDSDSVGFLFTRAPAANRFEIAVHGLEAHAGVCPEKGINAIQVAAEGIARMKLGRIDGETTANIGVVEGGVAVNIVPNTVLLKGEARSHNEEKLAAQTAHMIRCLEEAAAAQPDARRAVFRAASSQGRERDYDRLNVADDFSPRPSRPRGEKPRRGHPDRSHRRRLRAPTSSTKRAAKWRTCPRGCARSTRSGMARFEGPLAFCK